MRERTIWISAGLLGLAVAGALAVLTSHVSQPPVGVPGEPVSAGRQLAPVRTTAATAPPARPERPAARTTATTPAPPPAPPASDDEGAGHSSGSGSDDDGSGRGRGRGRGRGDD